MSVPKIRNIAHGYVLRREARRSLRTHARPLTRQIGSSTSVVYLVIHLAVFLSGTLLIQIDSPIYDSVGTSVIAAGLTGWFLFVMVALNQSELRRREAADAFGMVAAFPARSIPIKVEYDKRLAKARERIEIMGFGLSALREEYSDQMVHWSRVATVRIMLVDPEAPLSEAPYADQRDMEEGNQAGEIQDDVREFLRETLGLRRSHPTRFKVRLCRALPSINMFRIDHEAFWGPYLVAAEAKGRRSRNLPTMIVDSRGFMFDRLCEHFEVLWSDEELSRRPNDEDW